MHENGRAGETHFHMNGFARRLVLIQRQKVTRKWPICMLLSLKDAKNPTSFSWEPLMFSQNKQTYKHQQAGKQTKSGWDTHLSALLFQTQKLAKQFLA